MSSIGAVQPGNYNPHYCASKAALNNTTKFLSNHFASKKIRVNCVLPGIIETEGWEANIRVKAEVENRDFSTVLNEMRQVNEAKIPIGRMGNPEDVGHLVEFLISDKAQWVTGSCFVIDGGSHRGIF